MTRSLSITAAKWASITDGDLWLVLPGMCSLCIEGGNDHESYGVGPCTPNLPPLEFVLACAPCETCVNTRQWWDQNAGPTGSDQPCPDCRIKLVWPCPWPQCNGTVTLGHAYAVGQPLLLTAENIGHHYFRLAHYGPPESLVGRWALRLAVVS